MSTKADSEPCQTSMIKFLLRKCFSYNPLHKKWSFPLRIFPVNVTKSAFTWGFDHIYCRILNGKLNFLFITGNYFAESLITKDNQKLKHEKSQEAKACNFMKKRLWNSYFPVNFSKFLRTSFYRAPPSNLRKRTDFRDLTSMMELSPNRFSG